MLSKVSSSGVVREAITKMQGIIAKRAQDTTEKATLQPGVRIWAYCSQHAASIVVPCFQECFFFHVNLWPVTLNQLGA